MLAEVTPSDHPYLLYIAIGALMMLGPALNAWLNFIKGLKAEKISTTDFVTQHQLAELETRLTNQLNQTLGGIKEQIRTVLDTCTAVSHQMVTLNDTVNEEIRALHRSLGNVEGRLNH